MGGCVGVWIAAGLGVGNGGFDLALDFSGSGTRSGAGSETGLGIAAGNDCWDLGRCWGKDRDGGLSLSIGWG